jgi:heme exporter protein D
MLDLGPHASFIWAAYGVTLVAVATLAIAIVTDDRRQWRLLADLEKQGIRRRSARTKSKASRTKPRARKPQS